MSNRNTSTLCLFCEKSLSLPLRLIGRQFCSRSHEQEHVEKMNDMAVKGLHEIASRIRYGLAASGDHLSGQPLCLPSVISIDAREI